MKALIAISTCELYRQNGNNDAQRETWIPDVAKVEGLDYMFFTGRDTVKTNGLDEVRLDVPDDYQNVTRKMIESRKWALAQGYDFVFQSYPDVYIRPERLMAALPIGKDFVGYPITNSPDGIPYASGGAGYWNSRKACEYIVSSDEPYDWAEDRWVGHVMAHNHVTLWADQRYSPWAKPVLKRNQQVTAHLSRCVEEGKEGMYHAQWMRNIHKFWELSQGI